MKRQNEKAARDREVLLEVQEFVPHAEMRVKHERGRETEDTASATAPRRVKIPSAIAVPAKSCRTIVATNAIGGHAHFGGRGGRHGKIEDQEDAFVHEDESEQEPRRQQQCIAWPSRQFG